MLTKPSVCGDCPLAESGIGFARPEGQGTLKVALVGEALSEIEADEGLPFRPTAPAGSVLERAIKLAGLSRSHFALTNVVSCFPPRGFFEGARWEHAAAAHCKVHRDEFMARFAPKVIVALGNAPLKHLTEMSGRASEDQSVTDLRGYPIPSRDYPGVWVLPTYHPSFLRRGKKAGQDGGMGLLGVLIHDLLKAVQIARHGHQVLPVEYQEHPSLDDARAFLNRARGESGRLLTYDIETPNSRKLAEDERENDPSYEILSVQFSLGPQTGIFFPWQPPFVEIARELLALPNPKLGANVWGYDNPRLRAAGMRIEGRNDDLQWCFHHLQPDLRCGLQTVCSFYGGDAAWKHLKHASPEFYGIADVDYPQRAWPQIEEALRKKGLWKGYDDLVRGFHPILADMTRRGIPVDDPARLTLQAALIEERDREGAEMQPLVPEALRNVLPKAGYKKVPKNTEGMIQREFPGEDGGDSVARWCKIQPFLPNSSAQILRYIKAKGHPIPRNFKTLEETTEAEELRRLGVKTGDPIYAKILAYRKAAKAVSTYTMGWAPDPKDGCVHPQFGFRPATGQTSSYRPNAQNFPKHGATAKLMQRMIAAQPGHVLVNFDFKSFHALTLGFEAQDPDYMRAARLDIHSLVSGEILKVHKAAKLWEKSDEELREYFAWYKSDAERKAHRDKKSKPCIAEGELVLTDQGLISIENVTLGHRVWDGVEWVNHAGVIDQGVKEVITYDGLTATLDHVVFLEDGTTAPFREAASRMARLLCTGIERTPIRAGCRDLIEASAQERLHRAALPMPNLRTGGRVRLSLSSGLDPSIGPGVGFDWRTDHRAGQGLRESRPQGMAGSKSQARRVRVYDIADAGPRRCYTVGGKLVANCILGIGFGLGTRKLYQMNLDSFDSERDARQVKGVVQGLFPRVFVFQDATRKLAHRQGYLISKWSFIRWFWEVMRYDPRKYNSGGTRGDWVPGEDSESAIAFLPANDAFGHIRSNMTTLRDRGLDERFGLINTIHDSLVFHAPESIVEECVATVGGIMRAPSPILVDPVVAPTGLICDVEASVGPNQAEMSTVSIPTLALI